MRRDRRRVLGALALAAGTAAARASSRPLLRPDSARAQPAPDPSRWDPPLPFVEDVAAGPHGRVYLRRYAGGAATPLVVLHGGPAAGHRYLRPYAALAGPRPVVFYDQGGCGRSDAPADLARYTPAAYVAELEAVRARLGFARMVLLGHSWGGMLAPAYAAAHPDRVAGLVLAGTAPRWADFAAAARVWLAELGPAAVAVAARGSTDPGYGAVVERYYARHVCRLDPVPAWFLAEAEAIARNPVYAWLNGPTEFDFTGALAAYDVTAALRGVRVPTLVTCGEYDEAPPPVARRVAALIAGARLTSFAGLSHMSHIEDPARVVATTAAFVDTIA